MYKESVQFKVYTTDGINDRVEFYDTLEKAQDWANSFTYCVSEIFVVNDGKDTLVEYSKNNTSRSIQSLRLV